MNKRIKTLQKIIHLGEIKIKNLAGLEVAIPIFLCNLIALASTSTVFAAEPSNLSGNAPLQIQDTQSTKSGSIALELSSSYERTGEGEHRVRFTPELKYGLSSKSRIAISSPLLFGSSPRTTSSDLRLSVLYRFNDESPSSFLPSFAVDVRVDMPSGLDTRGVDTRTAFLMSRSLWSESRSLHFNALWWHNAQAGSTERHNRYGAILGYSHALHEKTVLVADYVYEQQRERKKFDRIIEFGVRHSLAEKQVIGLGVGGGLNHDAPDYRLSVSYQKSF